MTFAIHHPRSVALNIFQMMWSSCRKLKNERSKRKSSQNIFFPFVWTLPKEIWKRFHCISFIKMDISCHSGRLERIFSVWNYSENFGNGIYFKMLLTFIGVCCIFVICKTEVDKMKKNNPKSKLKMRFTETPTKQRKSNIQYHESRFNCARYIGDEGSGG